MPPLSPSPLSVLFVGSNPEGTEPLRLEREQRLIRTALERARHRERVVLRPLVAATIHDLRRALLEEEHQVVHISGHGEEEGLTLADEEGRPAVVPSEAMARYLTRCARQGTLRCVVLNACWTESIGRSPFMDVPYTVAVRGPLSDAAAQEFTRGFYDALGAGHDFETAFEEGRSCVDLAAPGAAFEAVLLRGEAAADLPARSDERAGEGPVPVGSDPAEATPTAANSPEKTLRLLVGSLIALVVLGSLALGAYWLGSDDDPNETAASTPAASTPAASTPTVSAPTVVACFVWIEGTEQVDRAWVLKSGQLYEPEIEGTKLSFRCPRQRTDVAVIVDLDRGELRHWPSVSTQAGQPSTVSMADAEPGAPESFLRRAVEQGLITPEEAERMAAVLDAIPEPSASPASSTTEDTGTEATGTSTTGSEPDPTPAPKPKPISKRKKSGDDAVIRSLKRKVRKECALPVEMWVVVDEKGRSEPEPFHSKGRICAIQLVLRAKFAKRAKPSRFRVTVK